MAFDLTARLRLIDDLSGPLRRVESSFGSLARTAGLVGGAVSAAFVVGDSVKKAVEFQAKMSAVQAVAQMSKAEMNSLSEAALQMGTKGVYSATEIASGMQSLAASGMNASQIMQAIPNIINAATASGEKFDSVAEIMQATMHSFGLKASNMGQIGDILAQSANDSAISIMDMGYTLKYAGPIADKAGQSLQSVAAAAAIMGNSGIKADQAGTTLRMGLLRMATEPKRVQDAFKKLGVSVTDSKGNFLQMGQIIDVLHNKFAGLSQSQKLKMAGYIFGAEASSGWVTLIDKADQYGKELDRINNSSGAAGKMALDMTDNAKSALKILENTWSSLQVRMGNLALPAIAQWAQGASDAINNVMASFQTGSLANVVTGISNIFSKLKSDISSFASPLQGVFSNSGILDFGKWLIDNGSMLTSILEGVGIALGAIAVWMGITAIATAVIEAPIYAVILALGVLAGLVIELIKHWDEMKVAGQLLWLQMQIVFENIKIKALEMAQDIVKALEPLVSFMPQSVQNGFHSMAAGINSALASAKSQVDALKEKVNQTKAAVDELTNGQHTFKLDYQIQTFNSSLMIQPSMITGAKPSFVPGGHMAKNAYGGLINRPILSYVGEDGPEMIVPLTKRARGLETLRQASNMLGADVDDLKPSYARMSYSPESTSKPPDTNASNEVRVTGGSYQNGGVSVVIPKIADQVVIREDADMDRIASHIAKGIFDAVNAGS